MCDLFNPPLPMVFITSDFCEQHVDGFLRAGSTIVVYVIYVYQQCNQNQQQLPFTLLESKYAKRLFTFDMDNKMSLFDLPVVHMSSNKCVSTTLAFSSRVRHMTVTISWTCWSYRHDILPSSRHTWMQTVAIGTTIDEHL